MQVQSLNVFNQNEIMTFNEQMNLMNQLKAYLDHFDLTAAQLSRKSGVSQQVLSQWMRGAEPKKVSQLKSVSEALGCSVDHLCFGQGITRDPNQINFLSHDEWVSGVFEVKVRRIK